jgi:carbamoyl-phosphate synthase small subunit
MNRNGGLKMNGKLVLENGVVFEGKLIGKHLESVGEVVFNTSMAGYKEIMTDPSYYGQHIVFTYPLIGNYGIALDDFESEGPKVRGIIVKEACEEPNNFRNEVSLHDYLLGHGLVGLAGVDTRSLTKLLRSSGVMKGIIVKAEVSIDEAISRLSGYDNSNAVAQVSTKEKQVFNQDGNKKVIMIDYGVKESIKTQLIKRGTSLTVMPHNVTSEIILGENPDLVFLSNGPGDPKDLGSRVETIKELIGKVPIAGICLGHQLLALACGGDTAKLKFGHRGANHPVKDMILDKVYITSQNHGYYVKEIPKGFEVTHLSMNDQTLEGMRQVDQKIMSVQFHPEASPGPEEAQVLFDEFLKLAK